MLSYIQKQAQTVVEILKSQEFDDSLPSRIGVLTHELGQLQARDFVTAAQYEFTEVRRITNKCSLISSDQWRHTGRLLSGGGADQSSINVLTEMANRLEIPERDRHPFREINLAPLAARVVLNRAVSFFENLASLLGKSYGGEGSHVETRSFSWIKNKALRDIVERDYKELMLKVYPSGAWKMTVVAAGSVLEAILYDLLTRTSSRTTAAMNAQSAPKKKDSTGTKMPRDIKKNKGEDKWDLVNLIEVANELQLLPGDRAKAIDQTLRDWRNFVHPHKEMKAEYEISDGEAMTAVGNLKCVCDHLTPAKK